MNNALVTVVVPVYNVEKYIDRCILSIINQTYKNLEIILVDDGSLDNSPQICDDYAKKDQRIKVVHKNNEGAGKARNIGIYNATGEYICFFDGDDYIELDTIEMCVAEAINNNADMVIFGYDDMSIDGERIASHIPCPPKQLFQNEEIKSVLLPMSLENNQNKSANWETPLSLWNKLYSVELIRKVGWSIVSEREIFSEDHYSLTALHKYLKIVSVINRVFYHYTVNDISLSRCYRSDAFQRIKIFYREMVLLNDKMGLGVVLELPIKSVTLGFIIGAMKQIVGSKLSLRRRYQELRKILSDELSRELVKTIDYSNINISKKLLYKTVEYKLTLLCFILVNLKIKRKS